MRSSCRLSVRGPLMVAAAGLVLSIAFSRIRQATSRWPTLCGAFLGLVNFASLYRFGITVLSSARASPRDAGQTDRSATIGPACSAVATLARLAMARPTHPSVTRPA